MANSNGWGDGAANNAIGWGQGANNAIGWGDIHADSWAGLTDISGFPTTDPDAQAGTAVRLQPVQWRVLADDQAGGCGPGYPVEQLADAQDASGSRQARFRQ